MGEVTLVDCEVPEANLLGREGNSIAIFSHSMEWERSYVLAGAVGTMQRQLERCVEHARERRQFGQPIGKFHAVSHRIVDIQIRVRTARLLLYQLPWLRSQGRPTSRVGDGQALGE